MRTQLQLASLLRAHYLPEKMVRMQRLQELRQFQAPLPLQPRNLGKALHPQRQGRVYQVHMNAHGKHWLGCWVTWWSWAPWLKTRMIVKTRKRTVMMTMMLMTMEARRSQKKERESLPEKNRHLRWAVTLFDSGFHLDFSAPKPVFWMRFFLFGAFRFQDSTCCLKEKAAKDLKAKIAKLTKGLKP